MTLHNSRILGLLVLAEIVSALEISMIFSGLGAWIRIYNDPVAIGWLVSSYLLASAAFIPICARLGDIFGRKRILVIAIGIAAFGSLMSAVGQSFEWILAGRAIQGIAASILPLCFGLARELLPEDMRAFAVGVLIATAALGAAIGLIVGGLLTDAFGPQSIFVFSAIIASASAIIIAIGLPVSRSQPYPDGLDWIGGLLLVVGIVAIMLAISNLKLWGLFSAEIIGLILTGSAVLIVWARYEARQESPLIDVKLLMNRRVLLANLVMICAAMGAMNMVQHVSLLLQQSPSTGIGHGLSATYVGLFKSPAMIVGIFSAIWAGWIAGRRGAEFPMLMGCSAILAASVAGAIFHDQLVMIFLSLVLAMLGVTVVYASVPNVVMQEVPAERTSESTGVMLVGRSIGQAVGAQMLVAILAASMTMDENGKTHPDSLAYMLGFWFMAVLALVGLIVSWRLYIERALPRVPGRA